VNPKDYEIAKELKEKLSAVVRVIDFKVFGSSMTDRQALFTYRLAQKLNGTQINAGLHDLKNNLCPIFMIYYT
jgi:hypothetical protein